MPDNKKKPSASKPRKMTPNRRGAEGPKRSVPIRRSKPAPRTKDGTYNIVGEPPGQRRTVARRRKVERINANKNHSALQKNIKASQRRRPY